MADTELKPCPFCGHKVSLITEKDFGGFDKYAIRHICRRKVGSLIELGWTNDKPTILRAWNRRANG